MKFTEYQIQANVTSNPHLDRTHAIAMACMGLAGEAGEVVDELKKVLYHNKQLDTDKIAKELGDVLWYLSDLCTKLHLKLEGVAQLNIIKLQQRHGGSFKNHEEQNRDRGSNQESS